MIARHLRTLFLFALLTCLQKVQQGSAQTLYWLGAPTAWTLSIAYDVSSDGQTVVGYFMKPGLSATAFRWTRRFGNRLIDTYYSRSYANAVSSDGTVVVGFAGSPVGDFSFRWRTSNPDNNNDGYPDLQDIYAGDNDKATGVSDNGKVIVGYARNANNDVAYRWVEGSGATELGTLGGEESAALDVSADGRVVVGSSTNNQGRTHAFVWTTSEGMKVITSLTPLLFKSSLAHAVSSDGRYVVGKAEKTTGEVIAFHYDRQKGRWTTLESLGGLETVATDVSADGGVVVGYGDNALGIPNAFVWTQATGTQNLNKLYGHLLDSPESRFIRAWAVSPDGRYIAGVAYHKATGKNEAFLLEIGQLTSSEEKTTAQPAAPQLFSNAPNPFSEATTLSFYLPQPAHVRLEVFDLLGRHITTLLDVRRPAGHHTVQYHPTNLTTGLYVYRLTVGNRQLYQKMLYLKGAP